MNKISASIILLTVFFGLQSRSQHVKNITGIKVPDDLENIKVQSLYNDSLSSSFLIWIDKEVKLHYHANHTEQVYILQGTGIMKVNNQSYDVSPGDLIYIPPRAHHSVKVLSDEPMKVLSIQAPKFVGEDRVFVKD